MDNSKLFNTFARAVVAALSDRPILPMYRQDTTPPPSPLTEVVVVDCDFFPAKHPQLFSNHGARAPVSPTY
jgi:hypothetical protein